LLAEWHITPEWVLDNWTNEELTLMVEKLAERKRRESDAYKGVSRESAKVSDTELFNRASSQIKVTRRSKHGD